MNDELGMLNFLFLSLATWRISSMVVHEKGPGNVFESLRTRAGIVMMRLGDSPEYYKAVPDTFLAQILDCVWCCSMWFGVAWVGLYYLLPALAVWLALPFAVSTAAIVVNGIVRRWLVE